MDTIFIVKHDSNFVQINNQLFRETPDLSLRAKGLLCHLLSNTNGWKVSSSALALLSRDGVTAIKSTLKELKDAGYLELRPIPSEKGKFAGSTWVVYEALLLKPSMQKDRPSVLPTLGSTTTNNTIVNKTSKNKESIKKAENLAIRKEQELDFEEFWKAYPRRIGNKQKAKQTWLKNKLSSMKDKILGHVAHRLQYGDWSVCEDTFIVYPERFLRDERWNDEYELPDRTATIYFDDQSRQYPLVTYLSLDGRSTGFYMVIDDDTIPYWMRDYVDAMKSNGAILFEIERDGTISVVCGIGR